MSRRRGTVALVCALLLSVGGAAWLHGALMAHDPSYRPTPNDALYLPKAELFQATTFGFRQLAADLLWFKLVQTVGDVRARKSGFRFIYQYADIVTDVDPRYAAPYLAASFWLVGWEQIRDANALLEKGRKRFPDSYKFPYYIGLNYFLWLHDRVKAIEYFGEAARLHQGSGAWTSSVRRAIDRPNDPEAAFDLFMNFYTDADSGREKQAMAPLVVHGLFYQLAMQVNQASKQFHDSRGVPPKTLDELVRGGLLRAVPSDPYGGQLYFDDAGDIHSTVRPRYWWESSSPASSPAAATAASEQPR